MNSVPSTVASGLVGFDNVRLTVSLPSTTESGHSTTLNVFDVSPGANVSVPETMNA